MLKALAAILDAIFGPINAMLPVGTGSAPPAQGGDVIAPVAQPSITKLVDRLPAWAETGAPTLLERLRVPVLAYSKPAGPAPIPDAGNEVRKPLNLDEAAWRASS
jgi:hypothetical protein